jgi:hypothetical protein
MIQQTMTIDADEYNQLRAELDAARATIAQDAELAWARWKEAEARTAELERRLFELGVEGRNFKTRLEREAAEWRKTSEVWQARAARLSALMQEAIDNCETRRGERDGCARCASFRIALSAAPASALALWRAYEVEHRLGETVEDGLGRQDPECNCDECNWIRARAAVEDAAEADIETAHNLLADLIRVLPLPEMT